MGKKEDPKPTRTVFEFMVRQGCAAHHSPGAYVGLFDMHGIRNPWNEQRTDKTVFEHAILERRFDLEERRKYLCAEDGNPWRFMMVLVHRTCECKVVIHPSNL